MRLFPHNNFEIPSYSMPSTIRYIIAVFCHKMDCIIICTIDSKVLTYLIFLIGYFSHLQKSRVKVFDYKKIPQEKVLKGHRSQNLSFWLRNGRRSRRNFFMGLGQAQQQHPTVNSKSQRISKLHDWFNGYSNLVKKLYFLVLISLKVRQCVSGLPYVVRLLIVFHYKIQPEDWAALRLLCNPS